MALLPWIDEKRLLVELKKAEPTFQRLSALLFVCWLLVAAA